MNSFNTLLLLVISSFIVITCQHDPVIPETPPIDNEDPIDSTSGKDCNPDSVYFNTDILPVITATCSQSNCHDANSAKDGIILNDYVNIIKEVKPGNPDDSDLYEVLTETDPDKLMPRNPNTGQGVAMDPAFIEMVRKWISQGAKNNICKNECDTSQLGFQDDIFPIIQTNCALPTCHNATGRSPKLTDYQSIKDNIDRIETRALINKTMPPSGPLEDCNMKKLKKWIDDGAQNN